MTLQPSVPSNAHPSEPIPDKHAELIAKLTGPPEDSYARYSRIVDEVNAHYGGTVAGYMPHATYDDMSSYDRWEATGRAFHDDPEIDAACGEALATGKWGSHLSGAAGVERLVNNYRRHEVEAAKTPEEREADAEAIEYARQVAVMARVNAEQEAERAERYGDWADVEDIGKPDTLCADGTPLLRSGALYTVVGDWSAGKSWLAAVWAAQLAREGRHVVWMDYEFQRRELRERLTTTLGLSTVELARVHYVVGQDAELDEIMSDAWHWDAGLVVVDAFTGLHDVLGSGSQNDADKVERTQSAVRPFTETGAAVCLVDHNNRSGESLGSQRKMSGVDAAFTLTNKTPFAVGVAGSSELTVAKPPRDGSMLRGARIAVLDYDGDTFELRGVASPRKASGQAATAVDARAAVERAMRSKLEREPSASKRDLLRAPASKHLKLATAEVAARIADEILSEPLSEPPSELSENLSEPTSDSLTR